MTDTPDGIAAAFALLDPAPAPAEGDTPDGAAPTPPAPDVAQLQGELEDMKAQNAALAERQRRGEMAGKVSDVEAAMKLLDPEKHLNPDGSVNLDRLRNDYPSLWIQVMYATAPSGGGGPHFSGAASSLDAAVSSGNLPLINYAFEQELKRG